MIVVLVEVEKKVLQLFCYYKMTKQEATAEAQKKGKIRYFTELPHTLPMYLLDAIIRHDGQQIVKTLEKLSDQTLLCEIEEIKKTP